MLRFRLDTAECQYECKGIQRNAVLPFLNGEKWRHRRSLAGQDAMDATP